MFGDLRSGETRVIGKRTPRVDSIEKLTGEAIFVSDMALPGMLFQASGQYSQATNSTTV